jgi:tryptophan synthase alpha chain
MLESYIRQQLKKRDILLMTHIVIGYPDLETSARVVQAMAGAGVELMELQIPFSEPIADGPVIESANQVALAGGITVDQCLAFARECASAHPIRFLFMSYYNIVHRMGVTRFADHMAKAGLAGAIVPDLPHEEGKAYVSAMRERKLDPIFLYAPTTPEERMRSIGEHASGFIYCVARKGVTGLDTAFGESVTEYLKRARRATPLPLAVGFGIKEKGDVDFLRGKAEIAIIGSEMIRVANEKGADGVAAKLRALRPANESTEK